MVLCMFVVKCLCLPVLCVSCEDQMILWTFLSAQESFAGIESEIISRIEG